jgi:pimeloyl-ACP methyl ester carboxylesterase
VAAVLAVPCAMAPAATHPPSPVAASGRTMRLRDRDFRWNLAAMTAAIGTFMDAVGVRRAALAGNSRTGGMTLAFPRRQPDRARPAPTLVLWGLQDKVPPARQAGRLGR